MGVLDEYRPGWFEARHWAELSRLAGVTRAYLAHEMQALADGAERVAARLAPIFRTTLSADELGFLADQVNPIVVERAQWLRVGAMSLR